jgi:hypothetical protein
MQRLHVMCSSLYTTEEILQVRCSLMSSPSQSLHDKHQIFSEIKVLTSELSFTISDNDLRLLELGNFLGLIAPRTQIHR